MVELYFHSPIRLHGLVLNQLDTEPTSRFTDTVVTPSNPDELERNAILFNKII
jgi:hypothetical protein